MSESDKPITENEVISHYKNLQTECSTYINKIVTFDSELNEHRLVEETMQPLDSDRRAFRMVGGVLVERTVGEVLPVVIDNRKKLEEVIKNMKTVLASKQKEMAEWKAKYNIRAVDEQ
jgi:prefoldin subunit 2